MRGPFDFLHMSGLPSHILVFGSLYNVANDVATFTKWKEIFWKVLNLLRLLLLC